MCIVVTKLASFHISYGLGVHSPLIFFQANLGNLDRREDCISLVISNLALVQCQGIVVGFVASIVAVIMDFMKGMVIPVVEFQGRDTKFLKIWLKINCIEMKLF